MNLICRCALIASLASSFAANAQQVASQSWSYEVTPYLWAAGLDGDTAADGAGSEIDTGYRFFSLDNLDWTLGTAFEAQKGRWSLLADGLYVEFSDEFDPPAFASTTAEVSGGFLETSAAISTVSVPGLDVVFGMRYVALNSTVQLTPSIVGDTSKSWLDPLVGVRYEHAFNDRWSVNLRGDIGGFGVSSDLATNVAATFGWRMTQATNLRFGYRVLQMDFADDGFVLDAILQGYTIGFSYAF
jgi:opacity protein-like surface antigen